MMCEQEAVPPPPPPSPPPPPWCPRCPHHVLTGSDAPVSYQHFCEAFGFPTATPGPAGASECFLLFYELRGSSGVLLQSGRATGCPVQGQHPENLLFDYRQGYLWTLLEVCDDISSILLYSNYSPCQEAGRECARSLVHFVQTHPWVRLDLLFSRLYHTQPSQPQYQENRTGLRSLASLWPRLSLSPISGAAWLHLLQAFVPDAPSSSALQRSLSRGRDKADRRNAVLTSAITGMGPTFLDLPPRAHHAQPGTLPGRSSRPRHPPTSRPPPPLTLLPPLHLTLPVALRQLEGAALSPGRATCHPVNVVRHVRMPSPRRTTHASVSPVSPLRSLLLQNGGRAVEVLRVTERGGAPNVVQSQHRHSERGHESRKRK